MKRYPISVWWQVLSNVDYWVKERGVNVLTYQNAVSFQKGDFQALHTKVESLRNQGYDLWVIRSPAYKFINDPLPVSFDQNYAHHLLAFALDDEFEDKVPGTNNLWGPQQPIFDYAKAEIDKYKSWMPNIPIYANFNGTHISDPSQDNGLSHRFYTTLANLGIDILSSDNYPICNQMHKPDGTLLWPDVMGVIFQGTRLLKQWTGKPTWTYLEVCNQAINTANTPGWAAPWIFNGSRAPTVSELWEMLYHALDIGSDGISYFPQAHAGAVNDATDPALIPVLRKIFALTNPPNPITTTPINIAGTNYKLVVQ